MFLLVGGILEHEAIPGISTSNPIGQQRWWVSEGVASATEPVTVEIVESKLSYFLGVMREYYAEPEMISQLFKQVFCLRLSVCRSVCFSVCLSVCLSECWNNLPITCSMNGVGLHGLIHYVYIIITDILHDQRSFVEQFIAAKRPLSLVSRLTDQVTYHVIVTWYRCMYHTMLIVL